VGNPWLDAGIVPFSTMPKSWFPADFITESFPGQFKNWFYAMIAMSTALSGQPPFKTVLGFATMLDSNGLPFHKSAGNAIEFVEGADKFGADVIRWFCASKDPSQNILFGQKEADGLRRQLFLILWNVFNFFVTYANLTNFKPSSKPTASPFVLDHWILARLSQTVSQATTGLGKFDAYKATQSIQAFISDLSLWYVRRSRDRVGPSSTNPSNQQACLQTLYTVLTTLSQLMAPIVPFISDAIYTTLTTKDSVHLSSWPRAKKLSPDQEQLITSMQHIRQVVEFGLAQRKAANLKVRQPLKSGVVTSPQSRPTDSLLQLLTDELNIKSVSWEQGTDLNVTLDLTMDAQLLSEGQARELIRSVQELRKSHNARLDQAIILTVPEMPPTDLIDHIKTQTLAFKIRQGSSLSIELL
jgi:isoleucyl-tRNA synthetase